MAQIIIKTDERRAYEARIMRDFGGNKNSSADRESAEVIAARTKEAVAELKRMEEKHR